MVVFGDGLWSVGRGKARAWLYCHVPDTAVLVPACQDELRDWLAGRGLGWAATLLVTRDDDGAYHLHANGIVLDVSVDDLPVWLRA